MVIKYKNFILVISSIVLLVLFSSLFFWKIILANTPDNPDPAPIIIDIGVCVDPPTPDLTNPSQPIIRWVSSGHPQRKYWLMVDDSAEGMGHNFPSPEINTGEVDSNNNFHQTNLGQLAQNKTYWYCVAVADDYGWTGWTGCNNFFLPNRQPSTQNLNVALNYCNLTANFTWNFDDPDYRDNQTAYQVQIDDNSDFSSPEVNSDKLNFSSSSYLLDLRKLSYNTTYNWRLKVWDRIGPEVSDWIEGSSFITPKHQGPSVDFKWTSGVLMDNDTVLVKFLDNSTVYSGTTKFAWLWTFENGNPAISIQQNPSASFLSSVSQSNVTLKVTDSDNYNCQTTKVVDVIGLRNKLKEIIPK